MPFEMADKIENANNTDGSGNSENDSEIDGSDQNNHATKSTCSNVFQMIEVLEQE